MTRRLQRPEIRVAFQNPRRPALPGVKQSSGILGGNRDAVDRHHQWTPQLRGLRTINDRQHDGQGLDAKVEFQQARRQSRPSENTGQRGEEIHQNIHARKREGLQSVVSGEEEQCCGCSLSGVAKD